MYHYVRNNEDFAYDTFCRRKNEFESQIDFFHKNSTILNPKDREKIDYFLNSNNKYAYLLTFDDGYKDHLYCAEYLSNRKISAFFFPPINSLNNNLLDVNAIHILIGTRGIKVINILEEIKEICLSSKLILSLNNKKVNIKTYLEKFKIKKEFSNILDDKVTLMVKRILQKDLLGDNNRKIIIEKLFKKFLGIRGSQFASKFYLNIEDLKYMKKIGMFFGSHGNSHRWLNSLDYKEQNYEIENSYKVLEELNLISNDEIKSMCYPYGAYNNDTIKILEKLKVNLGFSTEVGSAKLKKEKESIFKLPRWDTNNFWNNKWRRPCLPE